MDYESYQMTQSMEWYTGMLYSMVVHRHGLLTIEYSIQQVVSFPSGIWVG